MEQIINSLLDTDLYKFSMGQAIFHQFNDAKTTWTFTCRNKDVKFTTEMVEEIKRQIKLYCTLSFTEEELMYLLDKQVWFKESYVDFLRYWHPRYEDFDIRQEGDCGLFIETCGSWFNTSQYETPVLAIVNEVYFRMNFDYPVLLDSFKQRLDEKVAKLKSGAYEIGSFSEFGMRRRLSFEAQDLMVRKLKESDIPGFIGTSNVFLAMKYNLKAMGTMAHEWIMTVGQGYHEHNPAYSNKFALDAWVKEYGVLNGIALTDTITTDCFLKDFRLTYSKLFDGVRHDSGDPYEWGDKMIRHYRDLGINPEEKTLLFSDSLDFDRATAIYKYFKGKAKVAFGIGTFLSNDTCEKPLNIVMKVTEANYSPVAKISDTKGKSTCKDPAYIEYLLRCIEWRMTH